MKNIFKFLFVFIVALFFLGYALGYIDSEYIENDLEELVLPYNPGNDDDGGGEYEYVYKKLFIKENGDIVLDYVVLKDDDSWIGDIRGAVSEIINPMLDFVGLLDMEDPYEMIVHDRRIKNYDYRTVTLKPTDSKYQYILENNPEIASAVKYIKGEDAGFLYEHDKYNAAMDLSKVRLHNNNVNVSLNAIDDIKDWDNFLKDEETRYKNELKGIAGDNLSDEEINNYAKSYIEQLRFKKFGSDYMENKLTRLLFDDRNDKGEYIIRSGATRKRVNDIITIINQYPQLWIMGIAIATNYADREDFNIDNFEQLMKTLDYICSGIMSFEEAIEKNAYFKKELKKLERFWRNNSKRKVYGLYILLMQKMYYSSAHSLYDINSQALQNMSLDDQIDYLGSFLEVYNIVAFQLKQSLVQKRNMLYKKGMNTREIELQHKRDTINLINDIFQKKNYYILDQNIIKMQEILGYPSYSNYLFKKYF